MKKKVYEMKGMDNCVMSVTYLGVKVNLNFKNGSKAAKQDAQLITEDPFIQDAIEHSAEFGGRIRLARVYDIDVPQKPRLLGKEVTAVGIDEDVKPVKKAPKRSSSAKVIESVKNINDALAYFSAKGEEINEQTDIEELKEKYMVIFPNLK